MEPEACGGQLSMAGMRRIPCSGSAPGELVLIDTVTLNLANSWNKEKEKVTEERVLLA